MRIKVQDLLIKAGVVTLAFGAVAASAQNADPSSSLAKTAGRNAAAGGGSSDSLEEVIVTAQKRSERLQDVPIPVTALSAELLATNNQLRLQDLYTSVPGFMVAPTSSQTQQILSIRGLTTGLGAPTVGIVIDDVPYGSSTALGGGLGVPDLDPGDLARIEVLRGPQGTLYGANSLGGLAKFVTVDPSTSAVSGRLQLGTSSVFNGEKLGYNARGSINLPVSDTLAIRASAFTRLEPGWIDNPGRDIEGINEERASGGRLAALWEPSDAWSLKLSAMYQKTENDSIPSVDDLPGLGELEQSYLLDTSNSKEVENYSAVLTVEIGAATLTSLSGYNIATFESQADGSALLGGISNLLFGVNGFRATGNAETEKFSQEVRLSVPLGDRMEWLVGGYYTKEDTLFEVDGLAMNENTQAVVGSIVFSDFPTTYKEYAGFTDLTYRFTDRFDVQLGGRYTSFKQHGYEIDDGVIYNTLFFPPPFGPRPNPFIAQPDDLNASSFTYLLTPRWKVTPDFMMYARFASGYRAGGINLTLEPGVPEGYDPDETLNYELGVKAEFLNRTLSLDASVYHIDWKDIQLFLRSALTASGYFQNGGDAKSQGVEIAVQAKPATGLSVAGWVAWNASELTENLPPNAAVGSKGDRLPYSIRFSGKLGVEQSFPLTDNMSGSVGADVSYIGERVGIFVQAGDRALLPSYVKADLRAGVQYDSWAANLFVNNVTDRRGMLTRGSPGMPFSVNYIQPRTIGLSLTKTF